MGALFVAAGGQKVRSAATVQGTVNGTVMGYFRLASSGVIRRATGNNGLFECRTDTGTAMQHEFLQSGTSISFTMTIGVLHHIAFTWDQPSTTKQIFVDGVLNVQDTSATFPTTPGTGIWTIGDRANFGQTWDGYLDDIRWYTRLLTANEILTIFTMKSTQDGVATDVLFRHWDMRGGAEGTTVIRFRDLAGVQDLTLVDGTPTHADEAGIRYTRRAA